MPDRMIAIAQLAALMTDAQQRGDDRALGVLSGVTELLLSDKAAIDRLEERRRRDREKRPVKRPRISRQNPQNLPKSAESAEIAAASPSPTPARVRAEEEEEENRALAKADPMYEINRGLLEQRMGDLFPDALRFVEHRVERSPVTWAGWYGAMLSILTGGKATPEDLALVCRDDTALTRPVGTPKGLRVFVANAVEERLHGAVPRPPFRAGAQAGYGARRENPIGARPLAATEMLLGEDR